VYHLDSIFAGPHGQVSDQLPFNAVPASQFLALKRGSPSRLEEIPFRFPIGGKTLMRRYLISSTSPSTLPFRSRTSTRCNPLTGDFVHFVRPYVRHRQPKTPWHARGPSMKRSIVQAIIAPTALRENDVHAVANKRMRRYTKLSRKLRDSISFCLPDPMLVCSVSRFIYERIGTPCPHCCTKRQRSNYRLPHVRTPLCRGTASQLRWLPTQRPGATAQL
jgi:hypothetical protein